MSSSEKLKPFHKLSHSGPRKRAIIQCPEARVGLSEKNPVSSDGPVGYSAL